MEDDLTWRKALVTVGDENALLDVDGKPKNRWAAAIIAKGRTAHARRRREVLYDKRQQRQFIETGKGILNA